MNILRLLKHLGSLSMIGFAVACGGDTTEPEPDPVMTLANGNSQSAPAGTAVANPIVVRIARAGSGVAGTNVSWTVTGGGGSVDPTSSTTDNAGNASTTWTLGPNAGANAVQASASGVMGSPIVFGATGIVNAPPPMQATVSVGDNFFDPASQTVAVGGSVTWTWAGAVDHNVTFPTGTNSATQTAGMFSRSFPDAGSFNYQCTIHGAAMSGTIVVQ